MERWSKEIRRACAEREIGLEAAREVCLDRDAWRSLTDRHGVYQIDVMKFHGFSMGFP